MRRLLAILLVALFGLTTAAPLLAATMDSTHQIDAHLPACCRRNGAHHCMMLASTDAPAVSARCPESPRQTALVPHAELAGFSTSYAGRCVPRIVIDAAAQAEQQRCLSRERTRHKRGPPATFLTA